MQHVVITGASRGIGHATALLFAQKGYRVLAVSRNISKLQKLKALAGDNLQILAYDLTDGTVNDFRERVQEIFSQVDIIINNAGYLKASGFEETDVDEIEKTFQVNVFAVGKVTRALLPLLRNANEAHVVNVSSMGGFQGSAKFPGLSWYSASKAAIASLTEVLAEEYKETSIRFNCLALGAVQTEMLDEAFPGYQAPVTPEEMAIFFVDFATTGHRFFNGKVLPVALSTP